MKKNYFGNHDSLVVIDNKFSFWRDTLGTLTTTEDHELVSSKRHVLKSFINNAEYREKDKVEELLEKLLKKIKR